MEAPRKPSTKALEEAIQILHNGGFIKWKAVGKSLAGTSSFFVGEKDDAVSDLRLVIEGENEDTPQFFRYIKLKGKSPLSVLYNKAKKLASE